MEKKNLQIDYDVEAWTEDFIIPKTIDLKSLMNNPSAPFFMIQVRILQYMQYLPENADTITLEPSGPYINEDFYLPSKAVIDDDAADDNISQILSYLGVPIDRMQPIIRQVSSFARTMMSQPENMGRPLLPIVVGISIKRWDPRDLEIEHERKFGGRPEIEEEDMPTVKRQRNKV